MTYKILYIFVEGLDDERFFENTIKPEVAQKFDSRIDFMQECLKVFELDAVIKHQTNNSLRYFIQKYLRD